MFAEADEPAWAAEQVWRVTSPESGPENRWLLRCDNALAELELPFTPTPAQSAQISEQIAAWAACRGSDASLRVGHKHKTRRPVTKLGGLFYVKGCAAMRTARCRADVNKVLTAIFLIALRGKR